MIRPVNPEMTPNKDHDVVFVGSWYVFVSMHKDVTCACLRTCEEVVIKDTMLDLCSCDNEDEKRLSDRFQKTQTASRREKCSNL